MTGQPDKQLHPVRSFFLDEGKKWAARIAFYSIGAVFLAVMTPVGKQVLEIWNEPDSRAAADEAIIETQTRLLDAQSEILNAVKSLSGEDRVTRQPANMSYVREPVDAEDATVELILFIGRTTLGTSCILLEFTPQFTDENNVVQSLDARSSRSQIGPEVARRVIVLPRPAGMLIGRTGLHLQLKYQCGGNVVFENTKTVFFYNN